MYTKILKWKLIPDNLIEKNFEQIKLLPDVSPYPEYENFRQYKITDQSLLNYLQQFFKFNVNDRSFYQIIKDGIVTHIDIDRKIIFNYLIDAGGNDVHTIWYKDDKKTENFKIKIPIKIWHCMDVSTYHTVKGITGTRIAISVFERTK